VATACRNWALKSRDGEPATVQIVDHIEKLHLARTRHAQKEPDPSMMTGA